MGVRVAQNRRRLDFTAGILLVNQNLVGDNCWRCLAHDGSEVDAPPRQMNIAFTHMRVIARASVSETSSIANDHGGVHFAGCDPQPFG
jgi:hypothetical protein